MIDAEKITASNTPFMLPCLLSNKKAASIKRAAFLFALKNHLLRSLKNKNPLLKFSGIL
jgi:hypothetical protein